MPPMLLPAVAAAFLSALPTPTQAAPVASADDAQAVVAAEERVFVQLKIKNGAKELKHPGHKMETGEELVLVLTEGKKKHEVMVYVESADSGYKVEVVYKAGGKERVKAESAIKGKTWVEFKSDDGKSLVSLRVNPGNKRADGVDMPDGNDPLDGL